MRTILNISNLLGPRKKSEVQEMKDAVRALVTYFREAGHNEDGFTDDTSDYTLEVTFKRKLKR